MVPVTSHQDDFPLFPFPPPLIGAAGKTGKGQPTEIPGKQENGKNGKGSHPLVHGELLQRLDALTATGTKLARLADACLRHLSPEARADAFREVRGGAP